MRDLFTDGAKRAVFFAAEEAQKQGQPTVAPEHLLLGLLLQPECLACQILRKLDVEPARLHTELLQRMPAVTATLGADLQLSQDAHRAVDCAYQEARQLRNTYIGTEHLLLGLLRENDSRILRDSLQHLAAQMLANQGVTLETARIEVRNLQEAGELLRSSSAPYDSDTALRAVQPPSDVDSATELRASSPPANE